MKKYTCIYKIRNNSGSILGYGLLSESNNKIEVTNKELKEAMSQNRIELTNMHLTRDGKIVNNQDSGSRVVIDSVYVTPANRAEIDTEKVVKEKEKQIEKILYLINNLSKICSNFNENEHNHEDNEVYSLCKIYNTLLHRIEQAYYIKFPIVDYTRSQRIECTRSDILTIPYEKLLIIICKDFITVENTGKGTEETRIGLFPCESVVTRHNLDSFIDYLKAHGSKPKDLTYNSSKIELSIVTQSIANAKGLRYAESLLVKEQSKRFVSVTYQVKLYSNKEVILTIERTNYNSSIEIQLTSGSRSRVINLTELHEQCRIESEQQYGCFNESMVMKILESEFKNFLII